MLNMVLQQSVSTWAKKTLSGRDPSVTPQSSETYCVDVKSMLNVKPATHPKEDINAQSSTTYKYRS